MINIYLFKSVDHSLNQILYVCVGTEPKSGPVVLSDDLKNPAMEKLDLVRKWGINTYKVKLSFLHGSFCLFTTSSCLSINRLKLPSHCPIDQLFQ